MPRTVTVLVGTKKGAYRFKSGASRERWRMTGHDFAGQQTDVFPLEFPMRMAGVYFGTTSGELWGSADAGRSWTRIAEHLPPILSVETATA